MVELLGTSLMLVLSNNWILSLVKRLSIVKESVMWLRGALVVVSAIGVIATAALNGTPVDVNSLTSLGKTLIEILALAVGSHYSYRLIKTA